MNVLVTEKKQFKLWLEPEVIDRLNVAGAKFGRSSGQEVVEELIAIYLPTWAAVNESMRRAVDFQSRQMNTGGRVDNTNVEPIPESGYVSDIGELTDERKHKPIRKKAGK